MTVVASSQITIVDNNDAKPITGVITASPSTQQVYSKDESLITYTPDWSGSPWLVLTAVARVGGTSGAVDISALLTNRKWSTDGVTAITGTAAAISGNTSLAALFVGTGTFTSVVSGASSTLTIKANILDTVGQGIIYFDADYTDPATGLVSHITLQISLNRLSTGTNAVYLQPRGNDLIKKATGVTKSVAWMAVDLIRAAGIDTSGVTYEFYETNGTAKINTATTAGKYGMKTTTLGSAPGVTTADLNVGLPVGTAFSASNTLVISESAVNDMMVYRAVGKDADGVSYQCYFVVFDQSDPYQVITRSSSGDKLQNGVGSTVLTPYVYLGSANVADLTGWTFAWTFYNRNGLRGAFIDTTRTAASGGRVVSANTAGTASVITYGGAAITFAAGDIIKAVLTDGTERFYEVASGTGNTVTIRTPSTNTFLNFTDFPSPTVSQLVGGVLYVCVGSGGQRNTTGQSTAAAMITSGSVTLTGDEIDVKGVVVVDANRP